MDLNPQLLAMTTLFLCLAVCFLAGFFTAMVQPQAYKGYGATFINIINYLPEKI